MIVKDVYSTGFLAIIFILAVCNIPSVQRQPGPDEKQDRTLVDGIMVAD